MRSVSYGLEGMGDMAILCKDYKVMDACALVLAQKRLPHQVRKRSGDFQPDKDTIKVMTMKVSKGLEFPCVAIPVSVRWHCPTKTRRRKRACSTSRQHGPPKSRC